MKLLFVDNTPSMGGSVHHLAGQVRGLAARGHEMRVIASRPDFYDGILPAGVPVSTLSWPGFSNVFENAPEIFHARFPGVLGAPFSALAYKKFSAKVRPDFARIIREFKPDLIHLNNLNLPNKAFADEAEAQKIPLVVSALMIRLFSRRELELVRQSRLVTCISQAVATQLARFVSDLPKERLAVVESALDPSNYAAPRDPAVREEFGIPADARLVLSLGRLTPWKGHDVLVDALDGIPDVWFLQAGGEELVYRTDIDRKVQKAGLTGRAIFAGVRSDVPRLLGAADVLVHSSKYADPKDGVVEAFGRVIIEGMAAGLPVVATDAGGATEILEGSGAGMLVPPGDVDAMHVAVRAYLDDPEAAERAGEAGRRAAAERFAEAPLAAKLEHLYRNIIAA
ncbi:MAG: glycosyltransferase [Deltaproteobacteria bacterium]|nr:glycosyltransferase [Deltaproteobacteria bacterium]